MQSAAARSGGDRIDRPRFRQDLVAETIEDQGGRFIDVMDPESGSLYRFYEVEYSLACGMDGERDVAGIVKWAHDELGLSASPQEVRSVIATLGSLGFIGEDAGEPELAAGVVAGRGSMEAPASEVELGAAGSNPPARREPLPVTPNLALGAAGGGSAMKRPAEPVADVPLGAPGRIPPRATPAPPIGGEADVSLDLADHIAVRRDDVKEAVRASKVMSAVDVPQDLLDALEDKPTPKPELIGRPSPTKPAARPVDARPEPRPLERAPERPSPRPMERAPERIDRPMDRSSDRPIEARVAPLDAPVAPKAEAVGKAPLRPTGGKPAVELPSAPPPVDSKAMPGATTRSGTSPVLIVILILAVLGAAAFFVWKYVLDKPAGDVESSSQPATAPVKPEPVAPPPPPAPTAKIAMETPAPEDIKVTANGVIETILADKTVVKDGDVIVKLVGDKPIEAELTALTREQTTLTTKLAAATKKRDTAQGAGNKAAEAQAETEIATHQKNLGAKQDLLAAKKTELEKFLIHAATGGTFSPVAKQGQKVVADAVVAKLQADAAPSATFQLADTKPFAVKSSVELGIGKTEQHVACIVADVQAAQLKVTCPADPALTDGADVTLKLPAAAAGGAPAGGTAPAGGAPAAEAPPMPTTAGSATAPEAPPAGSDTSPPATK